MKKKSNFVVLVIILLINSAFMLIRKGQDLDEFWNYNFAQNILNGLLPYKDFNMIVTPMYPAIVAIFLKLFGAELLVGRLVAIVIFSAIMYISFLIMNKIIENKWIPILLTVAILMIYRDEIRGDYNLAVLLITTIVIFLEIIKNNKSKILDIDRKYDFFLGILVGISILTKQTTGIVLSFTFIMYKWILIENKNDLKLLLKISLVRTIGVLVPVIIFIIYMMVTNSISEFIDYSIMGISTFKNSFPYKELLTHPSMDITFKILGVLFPIFIILNAVTLVKLRLSRLEKQNLIILFIFSLQNLMVMYPLCDAVHTIVGILPLLLTTTYSLYLLLRKFIIKKFVDNSIKIITILSIIVCSTYSIYNLIIYINNQYVNPPVYNNKLNHFYGIPMKEGLYYYNLTLDKYIREQNQQGKEVYIISIQAIMTLIHADKHYKNYEMLVKGNLGAKGEEGIIEDIRKKDNAIFLIEPTESNNRQSTELIRKYIQENLRNIGKVSIFEIYEK